MPLNKEMAKVPLQFAIVDLFAGPGGLAEGFSAVSDANGHRPFKVVLSVEKEKAAHATLLLARSTTKGLSSSLNLTTNA